MKEPTRHFENLKCKERDFLLNAHVPPSDEKTGLMVMDCDEEVDLSKYAAFVPDNQPKTCPCPPAKEDVEANEEK